jgi:hypothetical protein
MNVFLGRWRLPGWNAGVAASARREVVVEVQLAWRMRYRQMLPAGGGGFEPPCRSPDEDDPAQNPRQLSIGEA